MKFVGRLVMYDEVTDLEPWQDPSTIKVGDLLQAIRGNGPREGEIIGTATITEINEGGLSEGYSIRLDPDTNG